MMKTELKLREEWKVHERRHSLKQVQFRSEEMSVRCQTKVAVVVVVVECRSRRRRNTEEMKE
jgi:hypothetical protein